MCEVANYLTLGVMPLVGGVALILMPSCALCALVRHFDYDRVDLAAIDAVLQHEIKGTAGELLASTTGAAYVGPPLAPDPCFFQFAL